MKPDAIMQIHCGADVVGHEREAVADAWPRASVFEVDLAMFFREPFKLHRRILNDKAMKAPRTGDETVARQGLGAGVDDDPSIYRGADHCDEHMQRAVVERTSSGVQCIAVVEDV